MREVRAHENVALGVVWRKTRETAVPAEIFFIFLDFKHSDHSVHPKFKLYALLTLSEGHRWFNDGCRTKWMSLGCRR